MYITGSKFVYTTLSPRALQPAFNTGQCAANRLLRNSLHQTFEKFSTSIQDSVQRADFWEILYNRLLRNSLHQYRTVCSEQTFEKFSILDFWEILYINTGQCAASRLLKNSLHQTFEKFSTWIQDSVQRADFWEILYISPQTSTFCEMNKEQSKESSVVILFSSKIWLNYSTWSL